MSFLISDFFDSETHMFPELFFNGGYCWEVFGVLEAFWQSHIFQGNHGIIEPGAVIKNPETVQIGEGSIVEAGAYITGPVIIGPGSTVRSGAYIRGKVITGFGCVIGHGTEIKNTILFNEVKACHFSYLGDSILGNRVNVGAGVKFANLRLDGKEILLKDFLGNEIATGRKKMGSFLGNDVSIGCNSVLNPGTFVSPGVQLLPLTMFSGTITQ